MNSINKKKNRKNQESYLFILMGLIILGLLISGYFLFVEKFLPTVTTSNKSFSKTPEDKTTSESNSSQDALPLFSEGMDITLYFGAKGKTGLIKETRKIPEEKSFLKIAKNSILALLQGPLGDGYSVIPEGTQLRSIFFDRGTFFVDFSSELSSNHPGGCIEEALTIFSIVNTLTERDKKARVRILINGNEVDTLKGHVSLKESFLRNEAVILK